MIARRVNHVGIQVWSLGSFRNTRCGRFFLRAITGPIGREFTGCDRVQTRDGRACENHIFCDDPFFAQIAAVLRKGK